MPALKATRALLALLAAVSLSFAAQPAPPPLERFDPGKPLPDAERRERVQRVQPKRSAEEVRQLLGDPRRVARQILYHRYFEQWLYDEPFYLRVEFECSHGQEAQVQSVQATRPERP